MPFRHSLKGQNLKFNFLYGIRFLINFKFFHTDDCAKIANVVELSSLHPKRSIFRV